MVLFALSFQGQVEKYGAYVGIAAFFGLAILSLLYFAQARELKRLREWAGRAPERARELEQRVVAQASAGVAPRGPALPAKGGIAPPRRLAEMPAPPAAAAQAAASAQATELADAVPAEDEPATNGNVPAAPGAGAAAAAPGANGAAPPVEEADGAAPAQRDEQEATQVGADQAGAEHAEDKRADQAESEQADVTTAQPAGDERAAGAASTAAGAAGAAAAGAAAAGTAGPTARAGDGERDASAAGAGTAGGTDEQDGTAAGGAGTPGAGGEAAADAPDPQAERAPATRPGEVPPLPRATPAQRVGVTPRPAPMPLRQAKPSATPASGRGDGPRRPGAAAARRPAGAPREGRSAGTIALFVGLAVLILGGGAFAVSQLGGDDTPPAPNRAAPPPTVPETGGGGRSGEPAKTAAETNVAVLNGTTFTGLAGQLADRVTQEGGYQRGAVETNTRDQTLQTSTIYYAEGFRSHARSVGELLSISSFEPLDADTQALAPDADVVVLAGADQAP